MLLRKHCGSWAILAFSALASGAMIVDMEDDPPLPAEIQPEPAVNPANILSAALPDTIFKLHYPRTSEQVRRGTQCTMFYSQDAITTSSGKTLYGIPVHPSDFRSLLQHANQFGRTQDVNTSSPSFKYSANGLTLIINVIASRPGYPTFTSFTYAYVAKILLDSTSATGNDPNGSWVGVVKNPSGAFIAEMGIIPESMVVPGTSYRLVVAQGTIRLPGNVLANIAKYVLDSVLLEPAFEGYTAILTNDQSRALWGPNAFSLIAHGGVVIDYNDLLETVRTIFAAVDTYSSSRTVLGPRRRMLVRNLEGQVISATSALITTWSIGEIPPPELAAASVCPAVVVTRPDDSIALGCIRS